MKFPATTFGDRLGERDQAGRVRVVGGIERNAGDGDPVATVRDDLVLGRRADAADHVARRRDVDAVFLVGEHRDQREPGVVPDEVALDDVARAAGIWRVGGRRGDDARDHAIDVILDGDAVEQVAGEHVGRVADQPAHGIGRGVLDQHAAQEVRPHLHAQDAPRPARPGRPGCRSRRSRPCCPAPSDRGCGRHCPGCPRSGCPTRPVRCRWPGRRGCWRRAGAHRRRRCRG